MNEIRRSGAFPTPTFTETSLRSMRCDHAGRIAMTPRYYHTACHDRLDTVYPDETLDRIM
jgi:hypothetical protein